MADERLRVTQALLEATSALSQADAPDAIILHMCEHLVAATPHIRLAWAWVGAAGTDELVPQIIAGPAADYARNIRIKSNAITRLGPAFKALASATPDAAEFSRFSVYGPWRRAAKVFGFRIAAALPIRVAQPGHRGVVVFYADDADYFSTIGMAPFRAFAQLAESVLLQAHLREELRSQAATDVLTGLSNRRALVATLRRELAEAARYQRPCALILLDLDHFKQLNDNHGHECGDRVLVAVADTLRRTLRTADAVGRWGGEEFLALLPDTDGNEALRVAEKLRAAIAACQVPGSAVAVTASFGVAGGGPHTVSVDALVQAADRALYEAKAKGRNAVTLVA
jgi:diguanylate cyclase (GGDEF)-like protein